MDINQRRVLGRALLHVEAQHRPTHPMHGHIMLRQLASQVNGLLERYPDDPALAAEMLAERMPSVCGVAEKLLRWGRAVRDCDPSDVPEKGAIWSNS